MTQQWQPQVSRALHQFSEATPAPPPLSSVIEREVAIEVVPSAPTPPRLPNGRRRLAIACAAILAIVVAATAIARTGGSASFADAVEASGLLSTPSPDDVARATDSLLWNDSLTQVSASGRYVQLLLCQTPEDGTAAAERAAAVCAGTAAFVAGPAASDAVPAGLLGEVVAASLELLPVDDRFFVVIERMTDQEAPARAWLIDAASGAVGVLTPVDETTTLSSPEQALVGASSGFPSVVDARDGTIRPLSIPSDADSTVSVSQVGGDRLWVGTDPDDADFGVAFSDDGGATWTHVAIPDDIRATRENPDLSIAAEGDQIAVGVWGDNIDDTVGDVVYVSDDAGRTWTTAALLAPDHHPDVNGAELGVVASGRLALTRTIDQRPVQVLASNGSDWSALEEIPTPFEDTFGAKGFSVNDAGVAISRIIEPSSDVLVRWTTKFSVDLINWTTLERDGADPADAGAVLIDGEGFIDGQTLTVDANQQAGLANGQFRVGNVTVAIACASAIGRDVIVAGTVAENVDGVATFDGVGVGVGDLVALVIRDAPPGGQRATLYHPSLWYGEDARRYSGTCEEVVESLPSSIDGGYFDGGSFDGTIRTG